MKLIFELLENVSLFSKLLNIELPKTVLLRQSKQKILFNIEKKK